MMTSNLLSRLLPSNPPTRSIYDDLRAHDEASESDIEEQAGRALDEQNLGFHDDDLHGADAFNGEDSRMTTESTAFLPDQQRATATTRQGRQARQGNSRWLAQSPRLLEEDGDDDVPASLLIEGHDNPGLDSPSHLQGRQTLPQARQAAIPGSSNRETRAHWEATQAQQRLHMDEDEGIGRNSRKPQAKMNFLAGSPRERAMWRWINVTNIDNFIKDVYDYYTGSGVWCIVLTRVLELLTRVFVAIFTTFLTQCVEFKKIPRSKALSDVLVPQCTKKISGMANVAIWLFALYVIWRVYQLLIDIPRLMRVHDFFLHLLEVPDSDMQTVSWQDIVARIMALRDANPITVEKISPRNRRFLGSQSKERLDAHDIANRLMRRENYLIALFNKDILDLTLPVPFLQGRHFFSKNLLWNLDWCIMDYIFNEYGQVRQLVLKTSHRRQLSDGLRDRFLFAGFMNVIFAPAIVVYLLIVYFFRYFREYQNNPSAIGARQYTPFAEWKFRNFNELQHIFQKRINMSHPFASRYLDQFPKVKMAQVARFLAFVAGAVVSVLVVATLWDPELFLTFEITPERTVLFYVTVFGALWAITKGMIPDENLVFDPEYALRNVIEYTHYMPSHWQDRLHSDLVKREFSALYQLRIVIFLEEILSIIITPFVLWFSLPKCSDQIIDFFREFTVHVDGVGYVCSFAVFDFKKGIGNTGQQGPPNSDVREDYYSTKHGKMAASYYGFLDNYLLNPKTGVPGHLPPGMRQQFHPPPVFPGLMSPALAADMQNSRMGRSQRRLGSRAPNAVAQAAWTPRFLPVGGHSSPMPSILLDPHHQPSTSGFGGRSVRRNSRSRYQTRRNIIEEPIEDEDETVAEASAQQNGESQEPFGSGGLDESRWEISPTRNKSMEEEEDVNNGPAGGGVLGLLYQFQKAQTEGRPGVNI